MVFRPRWNASGFGALWVRQTREQKVKALTYHGKREGRSEGVTELLSKPDCDAIINVTAYAICGVDLYVLGSDIPCLQRGDVSGQHTAGELVVRRTFGDRAVTRFEIPGDECFSWKRGFHPACERTNSSSETTTPDISRSILVVDDDVPVAETICEMLSDLGYKVFVADSGALALELVKSHAEIECVLTDHAMPEMNGTELASSIRKVKPHLPVVLCTGYADPCNGTNLQLPRLTKPYRQDDLRDLIATILSANRPNGSTV